MVEPVGNVRPPVATTLVLVVLVAAAERTTMYTGEVAVATPAVVVVSTAPVGGVVDPTMLEATPPVPQTPTPEMGTQPLPSYKKRLVNKSFPHVSGFRLPMVGLGKTLISSLQLKNRLWPRNHWFLKR